MNDRQAQRYLSHLGVPQRTPSLANLTELVGAHLDRVPFENISKLVRAGQGEGPGVPSLDHYLDGMHEHGLGGTCYVINPYLGDLLRHLGYVVQLRGADMDQPDVHIVNVVELDGAEWLVDCGYAAPFRRPLPLEGADPVTVTLGADRYAVHPRDSAGRTRMVHLRGGEVVHGYTITPGARERGVFDGAIADSFRPEATFLNCLYIARHGPDRSVALRDTAARIIVGGHERESTLPNPTALRAFVTREFGIPVALLDEALAWLQERADG